MLETFAERIIREQSERAQKVAAKPSPLEQNQLIQRQKTLEIQIQEYIQAMPPALRYRPLLMTELVNQLTGRYKDNPHPQHVGAALRLLGYINVRLWGKQGEGKRVWVPHIDCRTLS